MKVTVSDSPGGWVLRYIWGKGDDWRRVGGRGGGMVGNVEETGCNFVFSV